MCYFSKICYAFFVNDFINFDTTTWNVDLMDDMLTLVTTLICMDYLVWHHFSRRNYNVYSGYQVNLKVIMPFEEFKQVVLDIFGGIYENLKSILKLNIFFRVMHDILSIWDALDRKQYMVLIQCPMSFMKREIISHFLLVSQNAGLI